MTEQQLQEIEALDRQRTQGEWVAWNCEPTGSNDWGGKAAIGNLWMGIVDPPRIPVFREWDAAFIAQCSTSVPALCTALRAALAEIERLRAIVNDTPATY